MQMGEECYTGGHKFYKREREDGNGSFAGNDLSIKCKKGGLPLHALDLLKGKRR